MGKLSAAHKQQFPAIAPQITCAWCARPIIPNAARMRLFDSETTRVVGKWLAHFHPECGDELLDYLEGKTSPAGRAALASPVKED